MKATDGYEWAVLQGGMFHATHVQVKTGLDRITLPYGKDWLSTLVEAMARNLGDRVTQTYVRTDMLDEFGQIVFAFLEKVEK